MNDKQCLSVEQMKHLQEFGIELGETMMYWARSVDKRPRAATYYGKWVLVKGNSLQTVGLMSWEFVPAYTLQDILDKLPKRIDTDDYEFELNIYYHESGVSIFYDDGDITQLAFFSEPTVLESAYKMLCWVIEGRYLNKEEQQ